MRNLLVIYLNVIQTNRFVHWLDVAMKGIPLILDILFPIQADFYGPTGRLLSVTAGDDRTRLTLEHEYVTLIHWSQSMIIIMNISLFRYAWTWSLIISDISDEDAGEYTCRVFNNDRTLMIIKRFNLTILSTYRHLNVFTVICDTHLFLLFFDRYLLRERRKVFPMVIWWVWTNSKTIKNLFEQLNALVERFYDDRVDIFSQQDETKLFLIQS